MLSLILIMEVKQEFPDFIDQNNSIMVKEKHCNDLITGIKQLKDNEEFVTYEQSAQISVLLLNSTDDLDQEVKASDLFVDSNDLTLLKSDISEQTKTFKCKICAKEFCRSYVLKRHMEHHNRKKVQCKICLKLYSSNSYLKLHMGFHGTEKLKCNICYKTFKNSKILQLHMKVHVNSKQFKCDECPKTFNKYLKFMDHKRLHTGEKIFKCENCPKKFAQYSYLTAHLKMHNKQPNFICDICCAVYSRQNDFYMHQLSHNEDKSFSCEICPLTFTTQSHLKNHSKIHSLSTESSSKGDFLCKLCGICLVRDETLQKHLSAHLKLKSNVTVTKPYKCEVCGIEFKKEEVFNKHVLVNKVEDGLSCDICAEPLTLKCHVMVHNKNQPFPNCDRCFMRFNDKEALDSHYKNKHGG